MRLLRQHYWRLLIVAFLGSIIFSSTPLAAKDLQGDVVDIVVSNNEANVLNSTLTVLESSRKKQRWWHLSPNKRRDTNKENVKRAAVLRRGNNSSSTVSDHQETRKEKASQTKQKDCTHYTSSMGARKKLGRWIQRRHRIQKTSYRMAVLSTLAYWEFHKWSLPENAVGFRLRNDPTPKKGNGMPLSVVLYQSQFREQACRLRQRFASIRYRMVKNLIASNPQLSWPDNETLNEKIDKDAMGRPPAQSCQQPVSKTREKDRYQYAFDYWLYDWYEPSGVVKFHDTDLLISTSGDDKALVLAFGGTASAADAVTNLQTFEPANHSGFFTGGKNLTIIEGSLHRGFLNAYSRVDRGSVVLLGQDKEEASQPTLLASLYRQFGHCTSEKKKKSRKSKEEKKLERLKVGINTTIAAANDTGGCRVRGEKLMTILRQLVTSALLGGRTVNLSGHSLGGGLASLMALDIIINFPEVPVSRLHLWTFGAPQVADDVFIRSAIDAAPRLRDFVQENGNGRFHRFVTLSDDCEADFVSEVAKGFLPTHKGNLRGRAARRLGGVHGHVVHFADPHYLLTPDQYSSNIGNSTEAAGALPFKTTTRSAVAAHSTINYLRGISRESTDHPLSTDLPPKIVDWLGEEKTTTYANEQ
jgi:hypothetical protein